MGKLREFYPKYWKSEGLLASFYFYLFSDFFLTEICLLNRFMYLFNYTEKYWKNQGHLSVGNVGTINILPSFFSSLWKFFVCLFVFDNNSDEPEIK